MIDGRDREMLELENEEGSNLRWLVAAALIALGMTLVAMRYDDNPGTGGTDAGTFGTSTALVQAPSVIGR
jgi:hypothetical protein